jgi:proteasome alpha subunit
MFPVSKNPAMAYDRAITVFSPEGKLYQVEYAAKTIEMGTPAMAMKYKDGIAFLVDFNFDSKLINLNSIEKIFQVDSEIYMLSAGMAGDARRLVQIAREYCQENKILYDEPIEISTLAKKVAAVKQVFTQYGGMRPFGVSFIVVGKDGDEFKIYETEPSGATAEYEAIAIGKHKREVMQLLEKKYKPNLNEAQAMKLLKEAVDEAYGKQKIDYNKMKVYVLSDKGTKMCETGCLAKLK